MLKPKEKQDEKGQYLRININQPGSVSGVVVNARHSEVGISGKSDPNCSNLEKLKSDCHTESFAE